ncbi:MAG: 2-amino-4-hydroxy-6-hydroxymethyldihydropteridine diphosphokinase [Pseudomonadota bacterium]
MEKASKIGIGLGSNVGDSKARLTSALAALNAHPGIEVLAASRFYHTAPVGYTAQDWFVNAAAAAETVLSPRELLNVLLDIEQDLGRVRTIKWGPRLIDLDLLFYDDLTMAGDDLVLPHPFLADRRFVLLPLLDVAPDWIHPVTGLSPRAMLKKLPIQGQEAVLLWD